MFSSLRFPEPYDARVRAQALTQREPGPISRNTTLAAGATQFDRIQMSEDSHAYSAFAPTSFSRSGGQLLVFAAGATLTVLSGLITRRAVKSRIRAVRPSGTFTPSNHLKPSDVNGGAEAAVALGLATLNVASVTCMLAGGASWAFDISTPQELRQTLRRQMGIQEVVGGQVQTEETEQDIEQWMEVMTARMQGKNDQEIAQLVKQRQEKERQDGQSHDTT